MHVVKNVTESQTGTLFNIKGKTKDTWKSRQDLMDRGLKKSLHLQRRGESVVIPMACYHLRLDKLLQAYHNNATDDVLDILEKLEEKIIFILCKLERMFPPSFFDIMTRLLIHLPYEAKISVDTVFNKSERNDEMIHPGGEISVFSSKGRPIGHKLKLEEENFNHVNERHDKEFASWLQQRVNTHLYSVASEIRILSRGPLNSVNSYSGCMVNGYKFHTQTRKENRTCQNSGVVMK
ncbi:Myb domain protein 62, partial [Tanacetum coccineum]